MKKKGKMKKLLMNLWAGRYGVYRRGGYKLVFRTKRKGERRVRILTDNDGFRYSDEFDNAKAFCEYFEQLEDAKQVDILWLLESFACGNIDVRGRYVGGHLDGKPSVEHAGAPLSFVAHLLPLSNINCWIKYDGKEGARDRLKTMRKYLIEFTHKHEEMRGIGAAEDVIPILDDLIAAF